MEKTKKFFITALFFIFVIIQVITFLKGANIIRGLGFSGVEEEKHLLPFTVDNFLNGTLQKGIEDWLSFNIGLRAVFVKTENQINYSFFNIISATDSLIFGREGWIFKRPYIRNFNKLNNISTERLEKKISGMQKLQKLLETHNISFLFMISPNKANIYPEYVLDKNIIKSRKHLESNYDRILPLLKKYKINYMDGRKFFENLKTSQPYLLFSNSGIHWNYYSAYFFTVELIKRLEKQMDKKLIHIGSNGVEVTGTPIGTDDDLVQLMNILFRWPLHGTYRYHKTFCDVKETEDYFIPRILFVGDSFLWNIFYYMEQCGVYSKCDTYYYYKSNRKYPGGTFEKINKKGLKDEILKNNVVIIETNECLLHDIGSGFIEDALRKL